MAQKFLTESQFDAPVQSNSKLFVNESLWDNGGSQGTTGQVLSKNASNEVEWMTPSGGGGTIDGSGAANKVAIWSDADTLTSDPSLHWDSTNNRLGINTTAPSYPLDVQGDVYVGSGALRVDVVNKRVGAGIVTPQETLHVGGNIRIQNGGIKDGNNLIGNSGQVLTSTGTQTSWQNASNLTFRENKVYHTSWKVGTTGTVFFNPTAGGAGALGYSGLMVIPYDGKLRQLTIITSGTQTGFNFALVNYQGSSLWTSGTTSLTANVATTLYPNTTITKSTHRQIGLRMTRGTSSSGNYDINITATYEWS